MATGQPPPAAAAEQDELVPTVRVARNWSPYSRRGRWSDTTADRFRHLRQWIVGAAKLSNGAAKHWHRVFQHLDDSDESIDVVARALHVHTLEYLAQMLVFSRLDRARPLAP